jgi:dTDP-glucose pyrophosphorylase
MKKPTLVIMAAGMGSRYGGLKQIESIDSFGHTLIDYSIYDAMCAGFEEITFVIKKEIEKDFLSVMEPHLAGKNIKINYVYQELNKLPEGYSVPDGRTKPWGTAHAVLCCKDVIDGPFAVINADDYYGKNAFKEIADFLKTDPKDYCMVGFRLVNTLTENGTVARGICDTENGILKTEYSEYWICFNCREKLMKALMWGIEDG